MTRAREIITSAALFSLTTPTFNGRGRNAPLGFSGLMSANSGKDGNIVSPSRPSWTHGADRRSNDDNIAWTLLSDRALLTGKEGIIAPPSRTREAHACQASSMACLLDGTSSIKGGAPAFAGAPQTTAARACSALPERLAAAPAIPYKQLS